MNVYKGYDNSMKKSCEIDQNLVWQDIFYPIDTEMSNLLQTKDNLANRAFRFFVNEVQY